jgi:hypothetical protein
MTAMRAAGPTGSRSSASAWITTAVAIRAVCARDENVCGGSDVGFTTHDNNRASQLLKLCL